MPKVKPVTEVHRQWREALAVIDSTAPGEGVLEQPTLTCQSDYFEAFGRAPFWWFLEVGHLGADLSDESVSRRGTRVVGDPFRWQPGSTYSRLDGVP